MGNQKDAFLVFDLKDAEGIIQQRKRSSKVDDPEEAPVVPADTPQQVKAMPQEWLSSFGTDYYRPSDIAPQGKRWNAQASGVPIPRNDPFNATSEADLETGIASLIETMKERGAGDE